METTERTGTLRRLLGLGCGCALLCAVPVAAAPGVKARAAAPVSRIARLELSPASLNLYGRGAHSQVFVTAVLRDGSREDVTEKARFIAKGGAVRTAGSVVQAGAPDGRGTVTVAYGGVQASLPVTVTGTAAERPTSFRYDVIPVLTRAGCNQGTCHGNAEGKGGFKLSLKGEDPETDLAAIARTGERRVNRIEPGASLLLRKATLSLPHAGGRRFTTDSDDYRTLAGWIAEGARMDAPGAPQLLRLEVSPRETVLSEPARFQRLTVLAHFSDGSVRDVTLKSWFNAGDPLVQVTQDGKVEFDRGGDVAVLVRYADQLQNARLTWVPARKAFAGKRVPAQNFIDEINFRRLRQLRLQPSRLTTDQEFVRRAYLDATGTLPTPAEVAEFLAECEKERVLRKGTNASTPQHLNAPTPLSRAALIERLLARPEFTDFWTLKWMDILRVEERSLDPKGAAGYREWIREAISTGKPLDQFARELLTATGSTYASPPANYYRRTRTPIDLGETTAQVFLGVRVGCAKCHNHPFERWKQDDYYSLAAFFARVERKGELTRKDQFDKHELIGEETISVGGNAKVLHPKTDRPVSPALPKWVLPAGFSQMETGNAQMAQEADPRTAFAAWLTHPDNPFFARSLANRIWAQLLGRGIVDPVDDLRESNPPSNPELLDALTKELVTHRFDLRHLVRTIMNSRTYQLSSEPNATNAEDERFFSRGIAQRLTAEVLLDALSQATGSPEPFPNEPVGTRAIRLIPLNKKPNTFLRLFGQPARESVCDCERTAETTLGQSFALISGENIDAKLKRPDNRIGKLLAAGRSDAEIATEFYLAAVSRAPTARELEQAAAFVRGKADRRAALEDLLWALLNSKEFLLRR